MPSALSGSQREGATTQAQYTAGGLRISGGSVRSLSVYETKELMPNVHALYCLREPFRRILYSLRMKQSKTEGTRGSTLRTTRVAPKVGFSSGIWLAMNNMRFSLFSQHFQIFFRILKLLRASTGTGDFSCECIAFLYRTATEERVKRRLADQVRPRHG